eukprot:jgi/Botrbrau1/7581/Bobra.0159s0030.1
MALSATTQRFGPHRCCVCAGPRGDSCEPFNAIAEGSKTGVDKFSQNLRNACIPLRALVLLATRVNHNSQRDRIMASLQAEALFICCSKLST